MQGGELPLLDEPSGVAGARARPHAGAAVHQQSFKELGFARLDPSDSSVKARSGAGPRMCMVDVDVRMVADTTGEHGAGMAGHSDAAAQHVAGGADGAPARTRPEYDHDGLESLVGFLSVTDSQRLRKAGGAAPDKERLAQRANAEEWRLRSEVPPPLLFVRLAPWRPREARGASGAPACRPLRTHALPEEPR